MSATTRRRGAVSMLLGAAAAAAVVVTMMIPGLTPLSPNPAVAAESACSVSYYALDPANSNKPNPDKEVTGAFGPAVAARDEAGVKKELDERRECGTDGKFDPALTAAHYAEWSHNGLTSIKVDESPTGLNAFTAKMANDVELRGKVLAELKKLEGESTFSTAPVSAGIWSLYMMPNGSGGVDLKVGKTSANGTNAVFTHGDKVIRYRLDCGFQPNRETPFTNVPECTGEECAPPPPPEVCPEGTTGTPPDNCLELKWTKPTVENEGWTPRGTDNGVTDGKESQRQQESGDTRGNAGNDKVSEDTKSGDTTSDTKDSKDDGPVVTDGNKGGDDREDDVQDDDLVKDDTGGTDGATCVPTPVKSC